MRETKQTKDDKMTKTVTMIQKELSACTRDLEARDAAENKVMYAIAEIETKIAGYEATMNTFSCTLEECQAAAAYMNAFDFSVTPTAAQRKITQRHIKNIGKYNAWDSIQRLTGILVELKNK